MSDRTPDQERNAQILALIVATFITAGLVVLAIQLRGIPGP